MKNGGIAVAGNMIVDYVKTIDSYPKPGMLVTVTGGEKAVGGSVPNVLVDLAKMGNEIPLTALGCIGRDDLGDLILNELGKSGIDTRMVHRLEASTGVTDVMNARDTGERTFFHNRGANALFSPEHVDLDRLDARILHIAYLLLLDVFDSPDEEYGTVMARFLHVAQQKGFLTSIDVVSDNSGRFAEVVRPALKYSDYVIVNEVEGCGAFELAPRAADGKLIEANIKAALTAFIENGVGRMAVIHCPEAGFSMDRQGNYTKVPSLKLPEGYIQGSVGAGDAFCAGCLRAIYMGRSAEEMLYLGAAAAAASLSRPDATGGMRPEAELMRLQL